MGTLRRVVPHRARGIGDHASNDLIGTALPIRGANVTMKGMRKPLTRWTAVGDEAMRAMTPMRRDEICGGIAPARVATHRRSPRQIVGR